MKKLLTTAVAIIGIAVGANADAATWFNPQIETYTTWPTNNVALFGGEWQNSGCATLDDGGLAVNGDLLFVATETRHLDDGDVIVSGNMDLQPFDEIPQVPLDAKCGFLTIVDPNTNTNIYYVLAYDEIVGSNVFASTDFPAIDGEPFSVKVGNADSRGAEFVSVVYTFGGDKESSKLVYIGNADNTISSAVFSGAGKLRSLSGVKDDHETSICADWYVDASNGSDDNAGKEKNSPLKSLQSAIDRARQGDVICVAPGVYGPIAAGANYITIVGIEGSGNTFIDASLSWHEGVTNRCATLGATTNTVLRGFTLVNGIAPDDNYYGGGAYYGTLEDCVISNCTARYGGGTYYSSLRRCVVKNNVATFYGGGTYYGTTESTLIAENSTTNRCGGTYYGTHVNSTITANTASIAPGGCFGGTIRNTISYANTASSGSSNYYNVTNTACYYSCVSPSQSGTGNINSDPKFVDPASGDYSLQTSSPCVNAGWNFLSVDSLDAMRNVRTRGSRTDIGAYELQQGSVYDGNRTLYVSGAIGSDSNDGLSWGTSFKTIQAAINVAMPGDGIIVTNGTYGVITTEGKALRIESVEGADATIINGNSSYRCATLGTTSTDKATVLMGFTLSNGYVSSANGGGAIYGTLQDCIISNCRAYLYSSGQYGGGTYYTDAIRCVYTGCSATYGRGGAAYYGNLTDCSFINNSAYYGGGTYYGTISNCVYSGNSATSYNGGGAYYGTLYDCEVKNNTASKYGGGTYGSTLYRCVVTGNRATSYYGGGVYSGTLHECVISNNSAYTFGGGVYSSTMYNCLVVKNSTTGSSSSGGGVQGGTAYNCTICDNSAPYRGGMQGGTAYNCIIWGNTETRQTSNYANVSNTICYASCTLPLQANDEHNISADPQFVDSAGGNYRLVADSPCVDAALNIQVSDAVDLDGNFRVSNRRMDMGAYELQQSAEYDGVPLVFYVDAAIGDDGNFGVSADAPAKSISAVLERAVAGDEILVAPGVYSPINSYGVAVTIRSTDGPEATIIDASPELNGGVTNRCATLGFIGSESETNTVVCGFTLRNGLSMPYGNGTSGSYGGGSYCGWLKNCILTNNIATWGGGAFLGTLSDCTIVGNAATNGGGASSSALERCLVVGNNAEFGGGVESCVLLNSIIARNFATYSGGGCFQTWEIFSCTITENYAGDYGGGCYPDFYAFNTIVWGNSSSVGVDNYGGEYSGYAYGNFCCTYPIPFDGWNNIESDPFLVSCADGTYRIASASPCLDNGYIDEEMRWRIEWRLPYADIDVDFLKQPRAQGGAPDIGAIEGAVEMSPPGNVDSVTASDGVASEGILISWSIAPMTQQYRIYRAISSHVEDAILVHTTTDTSFFDVDTVPETAYWYFVQAENLLGTGAISNGDDGFRVPPLAIEPLELPEAEAGSDYACTMIGEGGRTPYVWSFHPIFGYYMVRQSNSFSAPSGSSAGVSGDDTCASYNLPWTFTYYGKQYNTVWLNSNGTLNFDGSFTTYSASASTFSNRVMVAVMWRDLNTSSGGVYVSQPTADSVMFRWTGVYYGSSSSVNFSVTLHKDGRIVVSHGSGNANGGFVGVSSGDGDAVFESVSSSLSYVNNYVFGPSTTMDWATFTEEGQITGKPLEPATNMLYVTLTDVLGNTITETRAMRVYASTNLHPVVNGYAPLADRVVVPPDCDTLFSFTADDPDGADLTYTWLIDGVTNQVSNSSEFIYRPDETFGGEHILSCIISDGYWFDTAKKTWTIVVPKWYVAPDGADGNSGSSFSTAFASVQAAVNSASVGDVVYVKTGVYSPVSTSNKSIQIIAAKDANPVIDGQNNSRCVYVGNGTANTNTVFNGFVIRNGNAKGGNGGGSSGGTFKNCVFEHCSAENASGGAAYYADLFSCRLTDNSAANGGAVYGGRLFNCQLDENVAGTGGGANSATLYNCTVTRNVAATAGGVYGGSCYNSIVWGNTLRDTIRASNAESVTMQYSCTTPSQSGTGNRSGDPLLSQSANGIFRLHSGSSCIDAGSAAYVFTDRDLIGHDRVHGTSVDIGATEDAITGNYVKVATEGPGFVSASTTVANDAAASITARQLDSNHALVGFFCDGVQLDGVTSSGLEHSVVFVPTNEVSEVVAVFETRTFLVSANGDDSFDGRTWETAIRTLQLAVNAAIIGDEIVVADGVYAPIVTDNKQVVIRSLNGWSKAIIDGGGTNRCVHAGDGGGYNQTQFYGFTIRNGRLNNNGYGAGARGGTFYNCVFENNVQTGSSYAGGATSGSNLYNCLLAGNSGYNGGGANAGTLNNCTVVGNTASNSGGGVYNGVTVRNSIIWDNYSPNSYSNYNGCSFTYSCTAPAVSGTGNVSSNPYFTAPAEGDWRLRQYSPCLDAGNNSYAVSDFDLAGTNRIIDATVDMGAFEGWVYLPVPEAIAGFSAEDGTRIGAVRLNWQPDEYARNYAIHRSETETFNEFEVIGTTVSTFFDDETATPETTYWYRVVGMNPTGEGEPSAADSGWCLGEMVFGENTLQTATAGLAYNAKLAISGGSGNYTWKTGADDYDVVYGEGTYLVSDTVSTGVSGDDACLSYPLPFDFPFYGKSYNKVWVNSNGTLNFGESYNGYSADEATLKTKAMIAVMWKDLRTGSGGVGVATNGTESITFLWNGASYYSGGAAVNASVTLYSDGTILCSYGSGNASGGFVGVSAGDGTHYHSINLVGTSLDNYDDIRFVPQDVPGGMTLATDGTLSGVATAPGTYTFTVFVTDSYGNGATQKVTLEVEENPNMRTVQFDLGEYGVRGGGGDLLQYVLIGGDATPPTVRAKTGWLFDGWTGSFTNIADSVVVTANYRSTFADLEVSSIEIPGEVMSGNNVEIRWTVANTGNPQFSGTMTEKITLVSAADENVAIDVASPSFSGTIARNASIERSATVAVPLKGWVGTWKVRVETAIRPSVREFDENNVTVSTSNLEITAAPLPDLSVKSIALDLNPAEYMPLDTVTVRYVVQNTGTGAATSPWRDRLYLFKNGAKVTLATVDVSDDIAAGAELERTIQCVIPELVALSGDVAFVVKVDCDDSIVELADDDSNENATWEATPNATLGKRIYLAFNPASVYENSGSVRFYAKRSGETDKALVLSLSAVGATSDVTFPAEITIGAGSSTASGYVYPIDNNVVEGARDVVFTLTPPVASGFDAVASVLTILDNEVPKLTMSFDKVSVKEGDAAIVVTVTRELVTDEPLTVYLNGVSTSHCSYPTSVVIPAGEASVTFEIEPVNNDAAEIAAALTLRASANGYSSATQSFTVEDDDVPSVTLAIYPEELSEGAGPNAAYAILSRVNEDNIGSAITVNLTPSRANQVIMQSSITIPAYTMAVRFPIGTVDNGDDEPDRDITITGSIYIPSCGCSGQPSSGDVIEATIRIIDNDTPALSLTADPSTMKEGLDHAGDLILSHNSVLTEDLVVSLSFDTDGEIEIPAYVVIPAGETSVTIPVKTIDDGETDGGKLVSVYADDETKAFKSASTWIQVSDQNLPDLKVMAITRPSSVYAGKKFDIEFETANVGFVAAPNEIEYAIHLVGGNRGSSATSSNKIYSGKITGGIVVNDSIVTSYTVTAPSDTGDYRIVVVLDPDGKISELDDANNSLTSDAIAVSAAYTATVTVAEKVYLPGDEIVFNGVAVMPDGTTPAANLPIDLYVLVNGMRRTYHLTADANGAFGMTFEPSSGEAGRYTIGACYPGVASSVDQDYFDILGMKRSSTSNIIWDYALGDVATRTVYIQNRSGTPLTGLTATFTGIPEECDLQYTLPDTIPANGSVALTMTATAVGVTEHVDYSKFTAHLEVAEGLTLDFPLYFHSQTQKAYLRANPTSINTTMAIGHTRYIDVTISNDGKGDSGLITLSIPDVNWLRIVSGTTIDNLASGESATVTLEVAPEESYNLVLNNPLRGGRFTANCENGTGVSIALTFTPVSDNVGSVFVDTLDNNTYVLESGPHLSNAVVRITNPYTGALVRSGTTGQNGTWEASGIPEGRYQLTITAANHDSYADELIIEPEKTSNVEAFLQYQIVTATWNVERTEIEDSYEVTLLLDFETSVPAPVVNTIMPTDFPTLNEGESWSFTITLQNTGVIAAERVTVIMPEIEGYTFTLSDNDVAVPAKSSVEISGVFSRPKKSLLTSNALKATSVTVVTSVSCTYRSRTIVVYPCGKEHPEYSYERILRHGECEVSTSIYISTDDNWNPGNGSSGGGGGDPSRVIGPGGGTYGSGGFSVGPGSTYTKKDNCNLCYSQLRDALSDCTWAIEMGSSLGRDYLGRLSNPNISRVPYNYNSLDMVMPPDDDLRLGGPMKDVYHDDDHNQGPAVEMQYHRKPNSELNNLLPDNKSRVDDSGCIVANDGFKASVYDSDNDEIVLAFAGTDGIFAGKDMAANIMNGACLETAQYERAAKLLAKVKAQYPDKKIRVTGHSLGGGLAEYAVAKNNYASNVSAVTYNSAGICPTLLPEGVDYDAAAGCITNYRTSDDYVSPINAHIGPIYNIPGTGHDVMESNRFKYFRLDPEPPPTTWGKAAFHYIPCLELAFIIKTTAGAGSWLADHLSAYAANVGAQLGAMRGCLSGIFGACEDTNFREYIAVYNRLKAEGTFDAAFDTGNQLLDNSLKNLSTLALVYGAYERMIGAIFKGDSIADVEFRDTAMTFGAEIAVSGKLLTSPTDNEVNCEEWLLLSPNELKMFLMKMLDIAIENGEVTLLDAIEFKPDQISTETLSTFINRISTQSQDDEDDDAESFNWIAIESDARLIYDINGYAQTQGYANAGEMWDDAAKTIKDFLDTQSDAVCASVTLQLSQSVSMTREAFNGTLTMYNGNTQTPITALKMDVSITDEDGNECKDMFVANDLGNSGATSGGYILDGGLTVAAGGTGSSVIQFIPERRAAETEPKLYKFGGTITYIDPFSGESATIKLTPVALTVNPSPYLKLHYFIQRDVYGDDPNTETVEASMPAEMALLVVNEGSGNANNVTIASIQPSVVKNEKGLAADFSMKDYSLERTALNGATAHLGLNTVTLGTIPAGESQVAQWWLTSSIDGHFTDMAATVTPVNSWNTPDTMLVNPDVGKHLLIRSLSVEGETKPHFLVSEDADLYGTPNAVYSSDGSSEQVHNDATLIVNGQLVGSEPELSIAMTAGSDGWNYSNVRLDGVFRYRVVSVVRADNTVVPIRNVWITNKIFRDGLDPLLEERVHIIDEFATAGTQTYTITLEAKPSDVPEVDSFNVENGQIEYVARNSIEVQFSKAIDASTFTLDDVVLRKQGVLVEDISSLSIAPSDATGTRFTISGLAALCGDLGRYELVVQCAGIYDLSGQIGISGKSVAWTLSTPDSPYILDAEGRPTKRVRRMDGVTTVTSVPVTEESAQNLVVTLNGTDVSQFVTISPSDDTGTRFSIEGLDDLQLNDGDYTLVIDCANLVGVDGGSGVDSYTVTWTRDTIAPVVNGVSRETGLNGTSFILDLTEDADPETISLDNVMLTRKTSQKLNLARGLLGAAPAGETEIALPATARLTALGDGSYSVSGLDSVILADGTYTLYFDATGVADEAGNEASGVKSVSWTVDTTPPDEVVDIAVSSEYGSVDTCVYTATRELTISGTVPESGLTVEVFAKYVGSAETLLAEPEVDGNLRFTADVTLPGDGNLTIIIRQTDQYGNSSDTEFAVYVDAIALGAEISGMPEPDVAADTLTITFLNGTPAEASALAATMSLTKDGVAVDIPNVTIARTEDRIYTVSGLANYTAEYGTYVFSYDVREVAKATSGMTGAMVATAEWVNYPLDTTAPTIADIKFNDEAPAAAYVTDQMFTEVAVRFSEAVNVPELVDQGVAGQAFSIQFLSDDNEIVGRLPAEDVAWNASTFTASWTIDGSAVPCGKARLVVDASLVKDASGNGLAATEAYDIISVAKTYVPSVLKRHVAHSYACPALYDWNNDGLLDLVVGEKTEDGKGKVRIYLNRGTASQPEFDDYTYLQKDGEDVEFVAQGCVGMQVSFGRANGATMFIATSQGEIYGWRHRARNPKTKQAFDWNLWFDHTTDPRFSSLIRTQTFCCDIDGDGRDEVVVSGQNSPMFWMKRTLDNGEYVTECTPLMDTDGANLQFPAGQNHTAAIMADVSGDAVLDLVTGDTSGNVWVYYGTGSARFAATPVMIYENTEASNKRSRLAIGDIDGDGVEDILVGRQDGSVLLLKGEAILSPAVNFKCVEIKSVEEALNDYIYWVDGAEGWTCEQFGEEAQATVTHTGDDQTTVLSAKFTGVGTVTFTWAAIGSNESSEFRCTGGDSTIVKNGPFNQLAQSVTISTPGEHVVNWVFTGRNTAIVRDVAFTPADEALQVTQTTAVPIAFSDINRFANEIWKANGGDYEATANATAANGKTVMDNCIAGVDSSDPNAEFRAKITCENGVPKISWIPALNGEIDNEGVPTGIRTYKVYGTGSLETPEWRLVTPENKSGMRFFKVTVEMP